MTGKEKQKVKERKTIPWFSLVDRIAPALL
jgi:hypothetical protein